MTHDTPTDREAVNKSIGMCRAHGLHGTEATLRALLTRAEAAEADKDSLREALEGIHEITSKPFQSDNASVRQWVEVHSRKTLNALADKGEG